MNPDLRIAINEGGLLLQRAFQGQDDSLVRKAITRLEAGLQPESTSRIISPKDYHPEEEQEFIPSGCEWLDTALGGGMRVEEMILVGGTPYSGKTHLMAYMAGWYLMQGHNVLHFNGEDLVRDVVRLYSATTKGQHLENLRIADVVDQRFSPRLVEDDIKRVIDGGYYPDIVVVDHIDLMSSHSNQQDWLAVSDHALQLRNIGKKYGLIMVVGTQVNYGQGNPVQRLFRGKVGKAMHGDVLLFIDSREGNELNLWIEKGRGRKLGDRRLFVSFDSDMNLVLTRKEAY